MGRLTRDPDIRYSNSQNGEQMVIARYTLAVDRRFAKRNTGDNQQNADFVSCVAFGKQGEFAEKYLRQGTKIAITGRIQTGSYTNKDNQRIYTTEVVVEEQEFAESKSSQSQSGTYTPQPAPSNTDSEGFMNIPEGIENDLPFK